MQQMQGSQTSLTRNNPQIENNLGLPKKLRNAIDARIGRN